MVDLKQELEGFQQIKLENLAVNASDIPDNIKNSIILYNKALDSIRTGSEDIAVIELKKAVAMNPEFYEAMNLLGLCYSYMKDYERAAEVFERVSESEKNGVKAAKYLEGMQAGNEASPVKPRKKAILKPEFNTLRKPERKTEIPAAPVKAGGLLTGKSAIIFAAGIAMGLIIMLAAGLPSVTRQNRTPAQNPAADENKTLLGRLEGSQAEYTKLEAVNKTLKQDLETANSSINYYKSAVKLNEAENLSVKHEYEASADLLLLLKSAGFKNGEKQKYDGLITEVLPAAAQYVYDEGFKLYNSANYQAALDKLVKIQSYTGSFEKMDAALYYMGKSYVQINDSRNALAVYQQILEKYPQSRYCQYARWRIDELTQQP